MMRSLLSHAIKSSKSTSALKKYEQYTLLVRTAYSSGSFDCVLEIEAAVRILLISKEPEVGS